MSEGNLPMSERYNKVGPERYYIVSESELKRLKRAAINEVLMDSMRWETADDELHEAESACRARPVPKWATHFAGPPKDWTNYSVDDETVPVTLLEEIRR